MLQIKRIFATVIDAFVIGMITVFLDETISNWIESSERSYFLYPYVIYIFLVASIFLRDSVFINASLGKRIMGLVVVDPEGCIPSFRILITRSFLSWCFLPAGYRYRKKDDCDLYDWELAHFRATVAERKKLMHKDVVQKTNKLPDILLKIYMIMFMFCSLSYPLNHTLPWLSGVCSVYNAYDFAFFAESDLVAGLCMTWIPVFMLLITVCYAVAIRYNNYLPFFIMAVLDLLVSLLFIIFKISSGLYTDLIFMIIGFVIRSLGFLGILFCSRLKKAK